MASAAAAMLGEAAALLAAPFLTTPEAPAAAAAEVTASATALAGAAAASPAAAAAAAAPAAPAIAFCGGDRVAVLLSLLPTPCATEAVAWLLFGAAAGLPVVLAALLIVRVGGLEERPADDTSTGAALHGLLCGL
jgi:hypothetical protein